MGASESKPSSNSQSTLPESYDGLNFYEILCVPVDTTNEDIRRAYYKRAKSTHPDKDSTPGAKERFQKLNEAYETLSNPEKRAVYDLEQENEMEEKTKTEFGEFGSSSAMPGEWEASELPTGTQTPGWFEWLFLGRSTSFSEPFARYNPERYANYHKHLPLSRGISAKDIAEHFNFCIHNAMWKENGKDLNLCTVLRNFFECIAYDEKRCGYNQPIPGFGRINSFWCPDDGYGQDYAQDFYMFWLNFDPLKTFEWAAVELMLAGDPRVATHIVMNHFKGLPQISMDEFCRRFIKQIRQKRKVTREDGPAQTRGPSKNQRKKQKQRNKAKNKNSW
uniref:J domain-containing protein n=1 Tax=Psilocybe cubensis TaxID=181762 RepID=A0A8H7XNJ8_PSICU